MTETVFNHRLSSLLLLRLWSFSWWVWQLGQSTGGCSENHTGGCSHMLRASKALRPAQSASSGQVWKRWGAFYGSVSAGSSSSAQRSCAASLYLGQRTKVSEEPLRQQWLNVLLTTESLLLFFFPLVKVPCLHLHLSTLVKLVWNGKILKWNLSWFYPDILHLSLKMFFLFNWFRIGVFVNRQSSVVHVLFARVNVKTVHTNSNEYTVLYFSNNIEDDKLLNKFFYKKHCTAVCIFLARTLGVTNATVTLNIHFSY